jgi:hypothetical protein
MNFKIIILMKMNNMIKKLYKEILNMILITYQGRTVKIINKKDKSKIINKVILI